MNNHRAKVWLGIALLAVSLGPRAAFPSEVPSPAGIASQNPGDRGIEKDADVIFFDDFESWQADGAEPPRKNWEVRRNKVSRTQAVPGQIVSDDQRVPGENVLEIACWTTGAGSQTGGLSLKLGNYNHANEGLGDGYDELFIRYYVKFDESYRAVQNHGANLGGRDLKMNNAAWVGMAGIRDVSSRGYFYSGVQPYGERGSRELQMGFYSYHLDKRGPWGENYDVGRQITIKPGRWYCIERHMKLNSVDPTKTDPAARDGIEELWIDGELTIRNPSVRFRRVPHLKITYFSLETYYHGLPQNYDREHPIKMSVDNVVIAKKYIGPVRSDSP